MSLTFESKSTSRVCVCIVCAGGHTRSVVLSCFLAADVFLVGYVDSQCTSKAGRNGLYRGLPCGRILYDADGSGTGCLQGSLNDDALQDAAKVGALPHKHQRVTATSVHVLPLDFLFLKSAMKQVRLTYIMLTLCGTPY